MRNAATLLLISLILSACSTVSVDPQVTAESAAKIFLASLDQGRYQEPWPDAANRLRSMVGQDDWANNLESTRRPLGVLIHREVTSIEFHNSLEEMPDGEYALLTFVGAFSDNRDIEEVVGLALDAESKWRVMGYYIH